MRMLMIVQVADVVLDHTVPKLMDSYDWINTWVAFSRGESGGTAWLLSGWHVGQHV